MIRTILYYPTIIIRNSDWIKQSIFYWDRISSIVPQSSEHNLFQYEEIKELMDNDIFTAFFPEAFVQDRKDLTKEFISIFESQPYKTIKKRFVKKEGIFSINCGKMPEDLISYVIENRIANRLDDDLYFNKIDGYLYMALLAKFLANEDERNITTPGTDNSFFQKLILSTRNNSGGLPGLSFSLNGILPVPSPEVTIKQIIKFKTKYEDELLEFRKIIYSYQEKLKTTQDVAELQDELGKCSEEIQVGVKKIDKACKSERLPTLLGGLETIFKIEAPTILATIATGITIPIEVQISGVVAIGLVSATKYLIDESNKNRNRLSQDSYSYLYHAKQKGIID